MAGAIYYMGKKYDASGSGSSSIDYSTNEQVIGTWIDGKPLYQKTIVVNNKKMGISESDSEITHGVSNIDFGFVSEILFNNANDHNNGYSPAYNVYQQTAQSNTYFVGATKIFAVSAWNANSQRTWIITIRYTKTTD